MEDSMIKNSTSKSGLSDAVALKDVESELTRRMRLVHGPGDSPILRACRSNLVIYCDQPEVAQEVSNEIAEIVATHPARVLLLLAEPSAEAGDLTATVAVRGRVVDPGRWVCSEVVSLQAKGRAAERLPYAVRGLLIGDLPTNLWWAAPQPPSMAGPLLYDLAEHAQQIIYDSIGWVEPPKVMAATAAWLTQFETRPGRVRWRVASDLNWRRLKYWRRILSQTLDPATAPGAIAYLSEIVMEHGPHAVIQAEPRRVTAPAQSRAELISRQLSDRERDPVFHESMAVALLLAQRLLGS